MHHFTLKLMLLMLLGLSTLVPSAYTARANSAVQVTAVSEREVRTQLRALGKSGAEIEAIIQRGYDHRQGQVGATANTSYSGIYTTCPRGAVAYFYVDAGAFQHWFETSNYIYQDYYSGYSSGSWYTAYSSSISGYYYRAIVYGNNAGHAGAYCQ